MTVQRTLGSLGEILALTFLLERGCLLIERNAYVDGDELDLVVDHDGDVVIVEVKTSSNGEDPIEAVDRTKAERIRRAAGGYGIGVHRLDVIAVAVDRFGVSIRWLPGAL
jgi:putative endonuclease